MLTSSVSLREVYTTWFHSKVSELRRDTVSVSISTTDTDTVTDSKYLYYLIVADINTAIVFIEGHVALEKSDYLPTKGREVKRDDVALELGTCIVDSGG